MKITIVTHRVPFAVLYNGKKEHIEKEQWKHDPLFSRQDAYTVLFDKAEDMEMEKDTGLTSVKIEWIYLKKGKSSGTILSV